MKASSLTVPFVARNYVVVILHAALDRMRHYFHDLFPATLETSDSLIGLQNIGSMAAWFAWDEGKSSIYLA